MKSLHLRITGRVQGVWYRGWTVENAQQLGLSGWVRNRSDGSVEALLCGPDDQVDNMVTRCWTGPANARVEHVDIQLGEPVSEQGFAPGFEQRPTV